MYSMFLPQPFAFLRGIRSFLLMKMIVCMICSCCPRCCRCCCRCLYPSIGGKIGQVLLSLSVFGIPVYHRCCWWCRHCGDRDTYGEPAIMMIQCNYIGISLPPYNASFSPKTRIARQQQPIINYQVVIHVSRGTRVYRVSLCIPHTPPVACCEVSIHEVHAIYPLRLSEYDRPCHFLRSAQLQCFRHPWCTSSRKGNHVQIVPVCHRSMCVRLVHPKRVTFFVLRFVPFFVSLSYLPSPVPPSPLPATGKVVDPTYRTR